MTSMQELRDSKDKSRINAGIINRRRKASILLAEAAALELFCQIQLTSSE